MTDIVAELLDFTTRDHDRGCTGREYVCSCGYDNEIEAAVKKAAAEIELLRLSLSETEDNTLLSYLADIRQKSGVGIKPMLSELADAIATALSEARATGRREGMEEAARYHENVVTRIRNDQDNYKGNSMRPTYKRASNIHEYSAAAIRAAMEKAE